MNAAHFSVDDKLKQFIHEIYTKHMDELHLDSTLKAFLESCEVTHFIMQKMYVEVSENTK